MRKILTLAFVMLALASNSIAQAPQLFAELGGPSVAGINFDTRFSKKDNGIGGRIGFGGFMIDGSGVLFVPVGINYLVGKPDTKHFFELGVNVSYVSATDNGEEADTDNNLSDTWSCLTLGYRYQPKGPGITFRITANPIFAFKNAVFWPVYGGVSVGYKFK